MNKSTKIILIAILLLTIIFAVSACVVETTIAVSEEPQTVFVKGNDLDLSAGKLAVTKGSAISEIALNAEGVTVTGYDKNTVGEQTLTITYDGASTTLKVNVIERMVALGHVADYVVGDKFDDSGFLKIAKDNGEYVNVRINDERIQLNGFDSATAGEKTVNVTYTDDSLVLNGSFNVTVWSSDNVRLTVPTQRIYDSHDTKINIAGGYLTVTANSGAVTKNIPLKEEWIKGFNPDIVTEEEPSKEQEITVEYPGQSVKYIIKIKLSDITRIQRTANALASLDWSGETPSAVTDEQGAAAMRALALYNALDEYDAELISKEDMLNIVRPAAVYGTQKWTDLAEDFSELFEAKLHSLTINCDKEEVTKTQFEQISALEKTSPLFTYGDILINATDRFGEETVYGEEVFKEYIENVCGGEAINTAISKIDLMLKMHDTLLAAVPANWQVSDLQVPETSAKIEEAVGFTLALSELTDSITERHLFNTVSEWRPEKKNDYFEILYRYYFEMYLSDDTDTQKAGIEGIDNLIDVCMPGVLETYYLQYIATLIEQYNLQYVAQDGAIVQPANSIDTISFIVNYRSLLKIRESIYNSDDEMIVTLFNEYSLNNIITQIQTADIGAFSIFGAANGEPAFDNLWTKYLDAIIEIGNSSDKEYSAQIIKSLFEAFIDLTPEMQSQFLASLNPYGWADLYVNDGTGNGTMFENLIRYYLRTLPESLISDENSIVFELFDAFQYYLYRDEVIDENGSTVLQWFLQQMGEIETKYGNLTVEDKTAFDTHIGFFYEKLSNINKMYDEEGKFVEKEISDEWAGKITELEEAYEGVYTTFIRAYMDYTYYPVFISAYEYTVDLYNDIIANAPQNVVDKLLYTNTITLFTGSEMETKLNTSYESFLYVLRSIYISMLLEYPIDEEYVFTAWEEYTSCNLREYFASLLDFYAVVAVSEDTNQLTDEMIKAILSGFLNLTDDEQALFVAMDGYGQFVYYKGLGSFFAKKFSDSSAAADLVEDILNIEISCAFGITNKEFCDDWKKVQDAYEALSEADKELFDEVLKDTYDYYNNIYMELIGQQTTTPETPSEGDNQD